MQEGLRRHRHRGDAFIRRGAGLNRTGELEGVLLAPDLAKAGGVTGLGVHDGSRACPLERRRRRLLRGFEYEVGGCKFSDLK